LYRDTQKNHIGFFPKGFFFLYLGTITGNFRHGKLKTYSFAMADFIVIAVVP